MPCMSDLHSTKGNIDLCNMGYGMDIGAHQRMQALVKDESGSLIEEEVLVSKFLPRSTQALWQGNAHYDVLGRGDGEFRTS